MSPGSAGLSVRKTARYAGEYRGSLHLSEIGEDTPVVSFVGVGQIAAGDFPAKAHVVKLAAD